MTDTTTTTFTLPAMGAGGTVAPLSRWLKKPGDPVTDGEPLLEVATDKVDTEISVPFSGTLVRILVHEEDAVEEGTELASRHRTPDDRAAGFCSPAAARGRPLPGQPVGHRQGVFPGSRPRSWWFCHRPLPGHTGSVLTRPCGIFRFCRRPGRGAPGEAHADPARDRGQDDGVNSAADHCRGGRRVTAVSRMRKSYKAEGRKISYLPFFIRPPSRLSRSIRCSTPRPRTVARSSFTMTRSTWASQLIRAKD